MSDEPVIEPVTAEERIEDNQQVDVSLTGDGEAIGASDRPEPVEHSISTPNDPADAGKSDEGDSTGKRKLDDGDKSIEEGEALEHNEKHRPVEEDQPRKRLRVGTQAEEKRRGQRLFGSLLGTLGGIKKEANSVKAQERAARQSELEQRQRERQQKAADEMAQKRAEEDALRRERQREKRQAMELERQEARKQHDVKLAGFLVTKTKPALYYMPWKLSLDQEAKVQAQIKIAKAAMSRSEEQDKTMQDADISETGVVENNATTEQSAVALNDPQTTTEQDPESKSRTLAVDS